MGFFYFPSSTIIPSMVEKLGQLFGSEAKVKIMRLFLLNQTQPFDVDDISLRARVTQASCRSEMRDLVKAGLNLGCAYYGSPTTSDKALMPFPALKMGPGDSARSHTANEYIYIDEIKKGIELYIQLLNQMV